MSIISTGYLVLGCGCTDCFPSALFFDETSAEEWADRNCQNPEGYIIKAIDITGLNLQDD